MEFRFRAHMAKRAAVHSAGAERAKMGGFLAVGMGIAMAGTGVGALFGAGTATAGINMIQDGLGLDRRAASARAKGAAMQHLARGPAPRTAYLNSGAEVASRAAPSPLPGLPSRVSAAREASDGLTKSYIRFQAGQSVTVSGYATPKF